MIFEKLVEEYNISRIIDYDPTTGIIPFIFTCDMEGFTIDCRRFLQKNIGKQKTPGYEKINQFMNLIERYHYFLGINFSFPPIVDAKYWLLIPKSPIKMQYFKDEVIKYRREIISLYLKITGKHLTLDEI